MNVERLGSSKARHVCAWSAIRRKWLPGSCCALFALMIASAAQSQTIAAYKYPQGAQQTLSSGCQTDACTAYIDPQDPTNSPMPKVAFYISNISSYPSCFQVTWMISVQYVDPDGQGTTYNRDAAISPCSDTWTAPWSDDVGGTATVTALLYDCHGSQLGASASFTFYIWGKIQSKTQVDANKGGMPWFTGSMITAESCAAQNAGQADQFSPTNGFCNRSQNAAEAPLWGGPDGIGLMQPDRAENPTVFSNCTYWNFLCNMSSAEQVLTSKGSESENNWLTQYETNSNYTAVSGDQSYSNCSFQTSKEPLGDHSYGDADWIQDYNSHSSQHWYLWWTGTKWEFKWQTSEPGYDYVPKVCNSASY